MIDMFDHIDKINEACPSSQLDKTPTKKVNSEKPKEEPKKIQLEEADEVEDLEETNNDLTEEVNQDS